MLTESDARLSQVAPLRLVVDRGLMQGIVKAYAAHHKISYDEAHARLSRGVAPETARPRESADNEIYY